MTFQEASARIGAQVKHGQRVALDLERVESDGTCWVWFGEVRESDGARICESIPASELEMP